MKTPSQLTHRFGSVVLATLLNAAAPTSSHAGILAYEGFDYTPDSPLAGLSGGRGWAAPWQAVNPNGGSLNILAGSLAADVSAPAGYDANSTGQSAHLISNYRAGRRLDTSAAGPFGQAGYVNPASMIGADGKTLYLSFMQQADGTSFFYEMEFHKGDLGDNGRIAGIGNDQGGDDVHLRAPAGTHTSMGLGDTNVNFYIVRIDFQDGNDNIKVWRNPTSATEPAEATLDLPAQADMSFNGLSFGAFLNSRQVTHDEVRIGETWADVLAPVGIPPAAPQYVKQPRASTSFTGGRVTLEAVVTGSPEPALQWYRGDTALAGKTEARLTLENVQAADAGAYKVVATNASGSVPSDTVQVTVTTKPANLIAYEGFNYETGDANLAGMDEGLGWAAPWQRVGDASHNVTTGNLTAGPNSPTGYDSESRGNHAFLPNGRRDGRLLDTTPGGAFDALGYVDELGNIGAAGKTLYLSFMQQPNGTTLFYEMEFHKGDLGDAGRIAGVGNDQAGTDVFLRAAGAYNLIGPGNTDVNLYVVRIDYKEGDLDDIRVYRNPVSGAEPAEPTLTLADFTDMSFNGLSMGAYVNGRTVSHDEIRLGSTWDSVVPHPSVPSVAPQITLQPLAVTAYVGGSLRLASGASGTPSPALQWYRGETPLDGQTGPNLVLNHITAAAAGSYKLTATNTAGSATSNAVTVTVLPLPAGLLAYEGFDYPAGAANLGGQQGGVGWNQGWQLIYGASHDVTAGSLTAGGGAPEGFDARSTGNHVFLPNARRDGRLLDTSPEGTFFAGGYIDEAGNIGAAGKTLYLSFLQQPNSTAFFYEFEIHRGDLGDGGRIGGVGNDQGGDNVNLRAPGNVHTAIGAGSTDVSFYVVRIDYMEGDLDDIRVYRNPVSGTEPETPDLTLPGQADMSFNGISLAAFVNDRTVAHDEIRMGATWASVIGGASTGSPSFTQWINGFTLPGGADKSETGDPDRDGLINLVEYAFGTNPGVPSTGPLAYTGATLTAHGSPVIIRDGGAVSTVYGRRKDAAAAGLAYTAQFSADLTTWQNSAAAPAVVASDAEIEAVSIAWPANVPTTGGSAAPRFVRFRITLN